MTPLLQASQNGRSSIYRHNHFAANSIMWFVVPQVKVTWWVLEFFQPPIYKWMEGWTSLFTQDGPPSHFSQKALQCSNETFTDRWTGTGGLILWPPRLLYLTTSIFCVSGLKHTHKKLACIWEATNTFVMWTVSRCVQRHMWSSHLPPLNVLNYSILLHAEVGNSLLQ